MYKCVDKNSIKPNDPAPVPPIPVTGDNTNLLLLAGMLVLSMSALAVLLRRRKAL